MGPAYASARPLSTWLVGLLVGLAVSEVILTALDLLTVFAYPDFNDPNADIEDLGVLGLAAAMFLLGLAFLGLYIITVVLFCIWAHRANDNARALGADAMQFTPGWTVGWFFVPIANLFKPYQALKEVFQASSPDSDGDDWVGSEVPSFVGTWWGFWLASNFVAQVEMRLAFRDDVALVELSSWIGLGSTALSLVATVLVIRLIREIDDRQARKRQRLRGVEAELAPIVR